MTMPNEPLRLPLVEPSRPIQPVVRKQRDERGEDEQRRQRQPGHEQRRDDDADGDGHVDIRA